jgi:hypothetical protein
MTEAEWLATDLMTMWRYLADKASERKLRLVAVACCRELWEFIRDERGRRATVVAERYADGMATAGELQAAYEDAAVLEPEIDSYPAEKASAWVAHQSAVVASENALGHSATGAYDVPGHFLLWRRQKKRMRKFSVKLLREVFGNPFHPVAADPSWRTSTVVSLAEGIYADRAFDRLPILADALQDAGCENPDVLGHCRGPGPHARGCWVVDLLLGKT